MVSAASAQSAADGTPRWGRPNKTTSSPIETGVSPDVNDELIHRDASDVHEPASADGDRELSRRVARHPVGVSERHEDQRRVAVRAMVVAVGVRPSRPALCARRRSPPAASSPDAGRARRSCDRRTAEGRRVPRRCAPHPGASPGRSMAAAVAAMCRISGWMPKDAPRRPPLRTSRALLCRLSAEVLER